jgi:hypothetical protein
MSCRQTARQTASELNYKNGRIEMLHSGPKKDRETRKFLNHSGAFRTHF